MHTLAAKPRLTKHPISPRKVVILTHMFEFFLKLGLMILNPLTENLKYSSRTSVARTLMVRLPWLFRTRHRVPWKKFHRYHSWDNLG